MSPTGRYDEGVPVDLAYLRAHPQHLQTFLTHQRIRETPVGGGAICQARRLTLEDGASVFAKSLPDDQPVPAGFFEAEANGLRWLARAGAVSVPELLVVLPNLIALEWVEPAPPSPAAAERFGRELAALHRAGADGYGAPWPGYIGLLPQDNSSGPGWADWFATHRLLPYLRLSADRQALSPADVAQVERLVDGIDALAPPVAEGPSRLHGDLWQGNLLWAADRVWLVDPAAHGGHRETDLAQLALFGGPPQLDRILASYQEHWPLADGWTARVPLHQLHLLLVHAAMFGPGYRDAVVAATRSALRA
jgi:fructosamine-3-kinase